MVVNGLRDQDRLDGASNFVIWKARILVVLDKNRIKDYALKVVVVSVDVDPLKKYEEAQPKAKCMILDVGQRSCGPVSSAMYFSIWRTKY